MYRYGHFGFIFLLLLLLCGMPMTAQEKVSVVRRLHYVSTDKPVYRPGEKIFFRDVLLDAFSNYPVENADIPAPVLTITGPRGEEVFNGTATVQHSAASFIWEIPGNISGGIYKVRFSEVGKDNGSSGERSFEIRSYRVPLMRTQVDFARRGYLPGEECVAVLNFSRSEGGVPADAKVTVMAVLDGKVILPPTPVAHNAGCAQAKFKLPAEIADGDGTVQFTIEDGGIVESAALTIPVLLDNYDVFFYPESGPLVTGISNRIYVEALHKNGKGADFSGEILCGDKTVARVSTGHDGRGVFELMPEAGCVYRLRITNAAAGTHREFNLPVSENGAQLRSDRQTYPFDAPVTFQVNVSPAFSGQVGKVVLRKRDGELSSVEVKDDNVRVTLPAGEAEGVLTATLYGRNGAPLAERLIFREPRFRVQMQIAGADRQYTPGEKVKLRITATDGKGGIMGGVNVGITVVDDSVLQMVQRREQAPRLPEMVYLENEVLHFADAAEFFRSRDGRGAERIDLLLGTQGWRRFVLERRDQIGEKYPDQVARILGNPVKPMDVLRRNRRNGMLMFKAMGAVNDAVEMMPMPIAEAAVAAGVDAAPAAAAVPAAPMVMEAGADIRPNVMAAAPAAKRRIMPAPEILSWRRIYAHKARGKRRPGDRTDFTETVFWCASQRTDPRSGVCEIEFELPDTIGTFRVMADASAPNGALGTGDAEVISVVPFQSEIKFPLFMSVGDIARMPVTLINATAAPLRGVNLALETNGSLELVSKPELPAVIPAGGRIRLLAQVRAVKAGEALIACRAVAGGHTDRVERKFQVVSRHFPFQLSQGGRFEAGKPLIMDAEIPAETENGSQSSLIQVFTSPAATMEAALAALLRKPHGCFEQTSSTNYPLVMAQQYFLSHSGIEPRKITEAGKLLEEGYKKLISFECREKGYEWFGASPAHEALTAYGLMEFHDMSQVMNVDRAMIENTRSWLLSRRDGKGGFLRNQAALDSFGRAPEAVTNAYILWALLESGEKPAQLEKEIEAVMKSAREGKDPYITALTANILWLAGRGGEAAPFADMLVKSQQADGSIALNEKTATITCSGGESRILECASLAALAWIRLEDKYIAPLEKCMSLLAAKCKSGTFGSTQSTVLVLKAINAYDRSFAKPLKAGSIQLFVDGAPFGAPAAFARNEKGIINLPECGLAMTPGKHRIELRMTDGSQLSAAIQLQGMTLRPANRGVLTLHTALDRSEIREGEALQMQVSVTNASREEASMPLAVVALPGGVEPRTDQLKELVAAGRLASFELQENALVLYWRGIAPGATITVPVALTAAVPGEYTAAASRTYLYYCDEDKFFIPGTAVKILPR